MNDLDACLSHELKTGGCPEAIVGLIREAAAKAEVADVRGVLGLWPSLSLGYHDADLGTPGVCAGYLYLFGPRGGRIVVSRVLGPEQQDHQILHELAHWVLDLVPDVSKSWTPEGREQWCHEVGDSLFDAGRTDGWI